MSEDGHLSVEEEQQLYRHYNLGDSTGVAGHGEHDVVETGDRRDVADEPGVAGRDTSGPTTDKAMTRSEEQLRVGTESREAGTARLLRGRGDDAQAQQAEAELPDQVDTDQHQGLLEKFGINPGELLGGLGAKFGL